MWPFGLFSEAARLLNQSQYNVVVILTTMLYYMIMTNKWSQLKSKFPVQLWPQLLRLCRCAFIASKINWGLTQTNQTGLTQFSGLVRPGPQVPKSVQDWVSPQIQHLRVNLGRDGKIHYCTLGIHYITTKICFSGFIHNKLIHVAWNFSFFCPYRQTTHIIIGL